MQKLILTIVWALLFTVSGTALAQVSSGYWQGKGNFTATYPILSIDDQAIEEIINGDLQNLVQSYEDQVNNGELLAGHLTYYKKYEDNNIVNFMFYLEQRNLADQQQVKGFTITYDKHTGEVVPGSRYVNITLPQLQNALNHSKAFAVDGLDNGVNLAKKIPYVSKEYFIVTDGSIGLLYQPGDLLPVAAGATKIIIAPETVRETFDLNTK